MAEASQRRDWILPPNLPPVGINRDMAAAMIGVGATLFDRLVEAGKMPQPREIHGRLVWDVDEVRTAFRELPHRGETSGLAPGGEPDNPWDR